MWTYGDGATLYRSCKPRNVFRQTPLSDTVQMLQWRRRHSILNLLSLHCLKIDDSVPWLAPPGLHGSVPTCLYSVIKVRIESLLGTRVQRRAPSTLHLLSKRDLYKMFSHCSYKSNATQQQPHCSCHNVIILVELMFRKTWEKKGSFR
jgi:hypothetical protein